MALDSEAKRKAVTGVGRPWMRTQGNDAAKGVAWRVSVGLTYPIGIYAPVEGVELKRRGFIKNVGRMMG